MTDLKDVTIAGKLDRVTGQPATIYTPPEDLVEPPQIRPELHTLYRFWVSAQAAGEPVDQEFDGWWSGRHWLALYDIGVWDPQFVVRFEPLVDEHVAELEAVLQRSRDDHQGAVERHGALLADVRGLADEWGRQCAILATAGHVGSLTHGDATARLRALLDRHAGEQAQVGEG